LLASVGNLHRCTHLSSRVGSSHLMVLAADRPDYVS
jgi:hypothetical protein